MAGLARQVLDLDHRLLAQVSTGQRSIFYRSSVGTDEGFFPRPSPSPAAQGMGSGTPALALVRPYRSLKIGVRGWFLPQFGRDVQLAARPMVTLNYQAWIIPSVEQQSLLAPTSFLSSSPPIPEITGQRLVLPQLGNNHRGQRSIFKKNPQRLCVSAVKK